MKAKQSYRLSFVVTVLSLIPLPQDIPLPGAQPPSILKRTSAFGYKVLLFLKYMNTVSGFRKIHVYVGVNLVPRVYLVLTTRPWWEKCFLQH